MNFPPHTVRIQGHDLEYLRLPPADPAAMGPAIVFLHEGLGSAGLWRDFPHRVAAATGRETVIYSRRGHGRSSPPEGKRGIDYLHREALDVLPEFLLRLDIRRPVLFGHSDGASIALIHAGSGHPAAGLIVEAPHVMVEDITRAGIADTVAAWRNDGLRERLRRHHRDADVLFQAWSDIWLAPEFRSWNIEALLAGIDIPILAIQGEDDAYGTMAQVDRIAERAGDVDVLKLAGCGHAPHRELPEKICAATVDFLDRRLGR